jgi:CHAD domain-containing protein
MSANALVARVRAAVPLVAAGRSGGRVLHCDTFDWRLHGAGLTLEWADHGTRSRLLLRDRTGKAVALQVVAGARTPDIGPDAAPVVLPPGRVRDRVEPLLDLRVLLPRLVLDVDRRSFRRMNGDRKTVARVAVDEVQVVGAHGARARVVVDAVRGYEAVADDTARQLAEALELTVADDLLTDLYATTDRQPGDYTSKLRLDLVADEPAVPALARVFGHLYDAMLRNEAGMRADLDTEFLHDFRVAVRRTRSLLAVARPLVAADTLGGVADAFRALAAATGPARDLDVQLLGFDDLEAGLPGDFGPALEPLRAVLEDERDRARADLLSFLDGPGWALIHECWPPVLADMAAGRTITDDTPTIGALAAAAVTKAHRRLRRDGGRITADSPPEALHDLRKRSKVLRYRLEAFGPVLGPEVEDTVRALKGLQDVLGTYQDCDVQVDSLRRQAAAVAAREPGTADTLVAIGVLVDRLYDDQRRAHDEFAAAFARFAERKVRW